MAADDRFGSPRDRRYNRTALIALFDEVFATKSRDEWAELFDRHGVWWVAVQTPAEVIRDPQAHATGAFTEIPGRDGDTPTRSVASPVTFHDADLPATGASPRLGEHTREVLEQVGLEAAAIDAATGDGGD